MKIRKEINYYNILGLHPNINESTDDYINIRLEFIKNLSNKDIKVAYRNLSKIHHPDKKDGDVAKFKEIAEAYKILSNEEYRSEYDNISEHGLNYDSMTELYDFEFSNSDVKDEKAKKDYDKFKKKDLINILIELDEFQETIEYDRYIGCKHCECTGLNPDLVDMFDCEICDGVGKDRFEKKCLFCNGSGKLTLGFDKCPKCNGDKLTYKRETITIKESDFIDNKLVIEHKGNHSKIDIGRVGKLYISIT